MTMYVHTESYVYHMEPDLYIPGNIMFSDGGSLKTTDGLLSSLIVGSAINAEYGYDEGSGKEIQFYSITGFAQQTESQVVVVDMMSPCLQRVDRKTKQISLLLGNCSSFGQASESIFQWPFSIILNKNNPDQIFVTDGETNSFWMVDLDKSNISRLVKHYPEPMFGVLQDWSSADYLYLTFSHGVAKYNYQNSAQPVNITGSADNGFTDGPFETAKFNNPGGMVLLSATTLVVADQDNNRLRILDLDMNTTTSICTGRQGHGNRDLTSCLLFYPQSLLVSCDTLYVGEYKMIRAVKG